MYIVKDTDEKPKETVTSDKSNEVKSDDSTTSTTTPVVKIESELSAKSESKEEPIAVS